eukprot:4893598-Pleurochrysis_carterae.AAC.1
MVESSALKDVVSTEGEGRGAHASCLAAVAAATPPRRSRRWRPTRRSAGPPPAQAVLYPVYCRPKCKFNK